MKPTPDPLIASKLLAGAMCVLLALAACSGTSSSSTGSPGAGCTTSASCNGELCLISADFPAGYCSRGCDLTNPTSCGAGSVCIDDASGAPADAGVKAVCYASCQTTADCGRTGFACLEKAGKLVCRNGA